jgi:hypothetical protein
MIPPSQKCGRVPLNVAVARHTVMWGAHDIPRSKGFGILHGTHPCYGDAVLSLMRLPSHSPALSPLLVFQGLEECPICFLSFPFLNQATCCSKRLCSECYIQVWRAMLRPHCQAHSPSPPCGRSPCCSGMHDHWPPLWHVRRCTQPPPSLAALAARSARLHPSVCDSWARSRPTSASARKRRPRQS